MAWVAWLCISLGADLSGLAFEGALGRFTDCLPDHLAGAAEKFLRGAIEGTLALVGGRLCLIGVAIVAVE